MIKQKITRALILAPALALISFSSARLPNKVDLGRTDRFDRLALQLQQFAKMNAASAGGIHVPTILNNMRYGIGLVAGFSSHANYVSLACDGVDPGVGQSCDGPPESGIVGTITSIVNELPTIAGAAGIASCDAVPNSGSVTGTTSTGESVTLTFSPASHTIPSTWVNGGATYQHRVSFKATINNIGPMAVPLGVALEFGCGSQTATYTAISMDVDPSGGMPGYVRDIVIYNGSVDSSRKGIEVHMSEHNGATQRGAQSFRIYYNPTSHAFNMWGISGSNFKLAGNNDINALARVLAAGDYTTGAAKIYYGGAFFRSSNSNNDFPTSLASVSGNSNSTLPGDPSDFAVTADLTADSNITSLASGNSTALYAKMACVNFASGTTAAPGNAACSGFSLAAEDMGPAIDPTGHFNMAWELGTLYSKLERASY